MSRSPTRLLPPLPIALLRATAAAGFRREEQPPATAPEAAPEARGKPAAVQAAAGASKATTPAGKKLKTAPR